MKKFLSVLVNVFLIVFLTGCGSYLGQAIGTGLGDNLRDTTTPLEVEKNDSTQKGDKNEVSYQSSKVIQHLEEELAKTVQFKMLDTSDINSVVTVVHFGPL